METLKLAALVVGLAFCFNAPATEMIEDTSEPINLSELATAYPDEDAGYEVQNELSPMARARVRCVSRGFGATACFVPGRVRSVTLMRRLTWAPCIPGRTFGAYRDYMWVSRGCGGVFRVQYNPRW